LLPVPGVTRRLHFARFLLQEKIPLNRSRRLEERRCDSGWQRCCGITELSRATRLRALIMQQRSLGRSNRFTYDEVDPVNAKRRRSRRQRSRVFKLFSRGLTGFPQNPASCAIRVPWRLWRPSRWRVAERAGAACSLERRIHRSPAPRGGVCSMAATAPRQSAIPHPIGSIVGIS